MNIAEEYAKGVGSFIGANLYDANLQGANLHDANLVYADLQGANLQGANLQGANLVYADLQGANLYDANLQGANLQGANLYDANLQGANLHGANLRGANLRGANLRGANLPTDSHDVISELLRGKSGEDLHHRMIAGLVLVSRDWCWSDFLDRLDPQDMLWAVGILEAWPCFKSKVDYVRRSLEEV